MGIPFVTPPEGIEVHKYEANIPYSYYLNYDPKPKFSLDETVEKEDNMQKKYEETRERLRRFIGESLEAFNESEEDLRVRVLSTEDDRSGPMGGRSSQVFGFVDDGEEGGLVAFAINIYADTNIDQEARSLLDDIERERLQRAIIFGDDEE